jgi:hypothetical protein
MQSKYLTSVILFDFWQDTFIPVIILSQQYALCDVAIYRKYLYNRTRHMYCHVLVNIHGVSVNNLLDAYYSYIQIATAPSLFSTRYK